ncbi:MAG: NAD(P)-dependent oxidoreductase [Bacteroidota bacterium]|nr:NAD(P)-dependent oxidoreductase [Bacteroidota bacterium]
MKSILITGASGFIGSFLVEEGLKKGFETYAGIRGSSSRQYLKDPAIRFIEFDFSSLEKVVATLEDCKRRNIRFSYIIHAAGITKANHKGDFERVNCQNTIHFIEGLRKTGMIPEKFVFLSSLSAFGPGDPKTYKPVMLSDLPRPIELYGKSKLDTEHYICSQNDIPWMIFRPTGVYGPREKDYYVFFKTIGRGIETYIGREKQVLTFIYVKDLVRLIFDALNTEITRKSYFVADGKEYTTEEYAEITKRIMGKKTLRIRFPRWIVKSLAFILENIYAPFGKIPTLNMDKYRIMSSMNWRCEIKPLEDDFNFKAEYDLEKGVKETYTWYKANNWL